MGINGQDGSSHLFLVRLRAEKAEEGRLEWCGRVQRVVNGEGYTFRGWAELVEHLLAMLPDGQTRHRKGETTSIEPDG